MRRPLQLFRPPSWLRPPRRTARLRLTAVYGGFFLVSGALLLGLTYVLFERATSGQSQGSRLVMAPWKELQVAAQHASESHQLLVSSAIAFTIVAALAVFLGWVVAGRVLRPVREITATAQRISATNLHERLALDGADEEFKQLADTLDDLFARLEASFEAQHHFVANASHELRSPLTAERALLQVALANPATTVERWRATGQEVLASSQEQAQLLEALLTLASSEGGLDHRERVDLSALAERVLDSRRLELDRLSVHVEANARPAFVEGDPLLAARMVANLVDNALRHNVPGGRVEVTTGTEQGRAALTVANTGPVVPPGEVDRLFQPFQRLNGRRLHHTDGHGLGLSIVRAIAVAHGARITAGAPPDGGLTVTVAFPPVPPPLPTVRLRVPKELTSRGLGESER
jgi:signal transduction histidine kinase